jgi:AcrR family transcriptional regulator
MGRWEPNTRARLETAALELFVEHGFAETTVPQIAARAELTNRTFFRHFSDKREVLFSAGDDFPERIMGIVRGAPKTDDLWELVRYGVDTAARTFFPGRREYFRLRRAIIHSDPGLRERDLGKQADLAAAIRAGFLELGYDDQQATMAAQVSAVAMHDAIDRWVDDDSGAPLEHFVRRNLDTIQSMARAARPSA